MQGFGDELAKVIVRRIIVCCVLAGILAVGAWELLKYILTTS